MAVREVDVSPMPQTVPAEYKAVQLDIRMFVVEVISRLLRNIRKPCRATRPCLLKLFRDLTHVGFDLGRLQILTEAALSPSGLAEVAAGQRPTLLPMSHIHNESSLSIAGRLASGLQFCTSGSNGARACRLIPCISWCPAEPVDVFRKDHASG